MEESLRSWLRCSFDEIVTVEEGDPEVDDNNKFLTLGCYVFGLPDDSCLQDVFDEMSSHFGRDIAPFVRISPIFSIEACLICAVSSLSADRTKFVQVIVRMEPDVQANIMEALKNNLQHYFDADLSANDVEDATVIVADEADLNSIGSAFICDTDKVAIPSAASVQFCRDNDDKEKKVHQKGSNICFDCADNESKRLLLSKNLESVIQREKEIEAKLRAEITAQTNKLIDAEITIIEKDDKLSEKSSLLEAALCSIQENEIKINESNKMIAQLHSIQDEVDVLKPKADRAEASEQQLEKLRARLDELKSVKQQLKAESAAHSDTHSQLIESNQELDSFRKAKEQVDEYRGQCAESAIQIEELSARLRQRDDEIQRLEGENMFLRGGQKGQRLEAQKLSNELNAVNEQMRSDRLGGEGVGQGMSELNPALMNELHKLRTDNEDLLRKIDSTSVDSLHLLESRIADQKCINSSLQEKWMSAKDSLAQTLEVVDTLKGKLAILSLDYDLLRQLSGEARAMDLEDNLSMRHLYELRIIDITTEFNRNIDVLTDNYETELRDLKEVLRITEENFKSTTSTLLQTETEKESVIVDLSFTEEELREEKNLRTQDQDSAKIAAENFEIQKQAEIAALREEGQDRMQLLIEHHETNLLAEIERARDSDAELDGERIKRRRVDREKKFFEAETHRLKTLLNVSTGAGASGQDIEEALKEMKSMQTQLDKANKDIQIMRSQGVRTVDLNSTHGSEIEGSVTGVKGGALRPQRAKEASVSSLGSASSHSGHMGGTYGGYLEQTDVVDKRVEQLTREKRELLSKNLEENKERIEISQKLILSEREVRNLKAKVSKMTLEKERAERRAANQGMKDAIQITSPEKCNGNENYVGKKRGASYIENQENEL